MSVALMGRPKKQPAEGEPPRELTNLTVRGLKSWIAWIGRGADHCREDVSTSVDHALVEYFRSKGFEEPPPPRL